MAYRIVLLLLLVGTVQVSLPEPVRAVPIVFTDRAAFEAYVGSSTLLTLDKPTLSVDTRFGQVHITYNNLLRLDFNTYIYLGYTSGPIGLNVNSLYWSGSTLAPVTAFGFDIISATPNAYVRMTGLPGGFYRVDNINFLGIVSPDPVIVGIGGGGCSGGDCPFLADNFTAKPVPEPSAWVLLAAGLVGLFGWHVRHRDVNHA